MPSIGSAGNSWQAVSLAARVGVALWASTLLIGAASTAAAADPPPAPPGQVHRFDEHAGDVYRLALSHDRSYLATAGKDKLAYVLDATTLERVKKYGPHAAEVRGLAFMRDKSLVVATLREPGSRTIFRWDWDDDEDPASFAYGDSALYDLRLASSERYMAGAFGDQSVKLYPLVEGGERASLGPKDPLLKCRAFIFLPGGQRLLMGGGGGMAIWQVEDRVRSLGYLEGDNTAVVTGIVALRDGDQVLSCHSDGSLRIWSLSEERIISKFGDNTGEATSVAISPNGQLAATGGVDKIVRVWNLATKAKVREFAGHTGPVHCVLFPSDMRIASSSQDGSVRLWSLDAAATASPMASPLPGPANPAIVVRRERLPLPPAEKIVESAALMKTVFADDYAAAKTVLHKVKLIQKLLTQADDEKAAAADRYAFLQEAFRIAADAGQTQLALRISDQFLAMFVVPSDFHTLTMTRLVEVAASTKDQTDVAATALRWANDARVGERFDEADQLTRLGGRLAVKASATQLTESAKTLLARVQGDRERWTAFVPATEALAKKISDPAPRLAIGRYLCFNKGDWKGGLAHLARGPAGPLKELAEKEQADMPDGLALAEQWQAAAEKLPPRRPASLPRRRRLLVSKVPPHPDRPPKAQSRPGAEQDRPGLSGEEVERNEASRLP